jgi:DGQHR domain-containing protein
MAKHRVVRTLREAEDDYSTISYTASLVRQGTYRFYTLAMPSDVLAETATVDVRAQRPIDGFQRRLDERRAKDIAAYIDNGFGTIPGSIVLAAQPEAQLEYRRATRTISFKKHPRGFLILDGQHRVYGFHLARAQLRVPVVIYNGLKKAEQVRLFMDINTKQRPVPNELLLDIKRLAETEDDDEALLRDVFDRFDKTEASPLFGLMSPSEKRQGKISRVTFNAALRPIFGTFGTSDAQYVYEVLAAYIHAWLAGLRKKDADHMISNPILFRSVILLFPSAASRVSDRHGDNYTTEGFAEVLRPLFARLKKSEVLKPGASTSALHETFRKLLEAGFSIGRGRST